MPESPESTSESPEPTSESLEPITRSESDKDYLIRMTTPSVVSDLHPRSIANFIAADSVTILINQLNKLLL
jgi:hypothetical protein